MLQTHALVLRLFAGADELLGHATQLAPSATEYLPTPQSIQLLRLVAPVSAEDVPPAQLIHVPEPVVFLYFPAGQLVHAETAVVAEYVPARQFWHVVAFEALANLPAGQAVQSSVYMPREK